MEQFRAQRMLRLGLLSALAGGIVGYLAINVPVYNAAMSPVLMGFERRRHWVVAVVGLAIVIAGDALTVWLVARRRAGRGTRPSPMLGRPLGDRRGQVPRALRIQRVPLPVLGLTAITSAALLALAVWLGKPLWERALFTLLPWLPVFFVEEIWRYEQYGFYSIFVAIAVLQTGHLAEHSVQVLQLYMHHGDLARSHGVFGQLDFETVHFYWDTAIWAGACMLVYRYRDNRWLWISWAFASIHEVEHIYLYWVNKIHFAFYARGGIFGILGKGGLIGSPLARPYLHFVYNFLVVVPMLVGFWDQTREIERQHRSRAAPPPAERPVREPVGAPA
jgi:hypothetical protein